MAFWRGQVYYMSADDATIMVRDCAGGVAGFALQPRPDPRGAPDLTSLAVTPRDTLLVVDRATAVTEYDLLTTQIVWSWTASGVDDITVAPSGEAYVICTRGSCGSTVTDTSCWPAGPDGPRGVRRSRGAAADADVLFVARGADVVVVDLVTAANARRRLPHASSAASSADRGPLGQQRLYVGSAAGARSRRSTQQLIVLGELPGTARPFSAFGVDGGALWIGDGESARESGGTGGCRSARPDRPGADRARQRDGPHRSRAAGRDVGQPMRW